jgi:dihydrodipicolinate synthase/N-acetylneuraminate lyase
MSAPLFSGVGVALVTLFTDDGDVDVPATARHAGHLVDRGVRAVVVAGSTGEAASLSADERVALLEAVRPLAPFLVAGTGAPTADEAVAFTRDATSAGADAVLTLSPPGAEDPLPYYEAVRDGAGDLPVLGYHFPKVSEPGIAVERLARLPIDGVKDSSGDPERLLAELEAFDRPIYVGSSALLSLAGPIGAHGAILALANLEPEACAAAFGGDHQAQRSLAAVHLAAAQDFPRGLKRLLADRWGTSAICRM